MVCSQVLVKGRFRINLGTISFNLTWLLYSETYREMSIFESLGVNEWFWFQVVFRKMPVLISFIKSIKLSEDAGTFYLYMPLNLSFLFLCMCSSIWILQVNKKTRVDNFVRSLFPNLLSVTNKSYWFSKVTALLENNASSLYCYDFDQVYNVHF